MFSAGEKNIVELLIFDVFQKLFEKAEKMRAEILRKIAADFLRELCSGPDW